MRDKSATQNIKLYAAARYSVAASGVRIQLGLAGPICLESVGPTSVSRSDFANFMMHRTQQQCQSDRSDIFNESCLDQMEIGCRLLTLWEIHLQSHRTPPPKKKILTDLHEL
jgi:hypothetical protein